MILIELTGHRDHLLGVSRSVSWGWATTCVFALDVG